MKKLFTYGGFTFNINVELNFEVEKKPNGKRWHQVTVNIGDGSYHEVTKFEERYLIQGIKAMRESAIKWVDFKNGKTPRIPIEEQLATIGFK